WGRTIFIYRDVFVDKLYGCTFIGNFCNEVVQIAGISAEAIHRDNAHSVAVTHVVQEFCEGWALGPEIGGAAGGEGVEVGGGAGKGEGRETVGGGGGTVGGT